MSARQLFKINIIAADLNNADAEMYTNRHQQYTNSLTIDRRIGVSAFAISNIWRWAIVNVIARR